MLYHFGWTQKAMINSLSTISFQIVDNLCCDDEYKSFKRGGPKRAFTGAHIDVVTETRLSEGGVNTA